MGGVLEKLQSRVFPKERRGGRPQTIFGVVRVGKAIEKRPGGFELFGGPLHVTHFEEQAEHQIPRDRHGDGLCVGIVLRFRIGR